MEYIFLNSVNSIFNDNSKFHTFSLTKPILGNDKKIQIKLQEAEIPISYYNIISGYNDTFSFTVTNTSDALKTYSFTFPQKNYTSKQIITYINSEIVTQGASVNGITTSISFDEQTLNFSINCTADTIIVKRIEIGTILANRIMGYTNGFKTDDSTLSKLSLISPNASNLNRTKNIYFFIKSFNTNNSNSDLSEANDILAKVQANVKFNDIISYQNSSDLFINIPDSISYIDKIELKLLDDDNEFLDFNRLNFCLSLCVQFIKKDDVVFNKEEKNHDEQLSILEQQICEENIILL